MKKILIKISAFFMLALLAVGLSPSAFTLARAESVYTTVMQDLEKGGVNEADYPVNNKDYTITLFQIAEGVNGELFVYTYQPCQMTRKLVATSINMGLSEDLDEEIPDDASGETGGNEGDISGGFESGSGGGGFGGGGGSGCSVVLRSAPTTKLYGLTLISSQTVFCKYLVKDFHVSKDAVRYYNITSIYRKFNAEIDPPTTGASQTVNEVSFEVGELFTARTDESGNVTYARTWTETILITDKFCGKLRYSDGYIFMGVHAACDAWYVAFSTDKQIDKLLEADISYITQPYINDYVIDQKETHTKTLHYTDRASNAANGLFAYKYTWDRITSASDFLKENDGKLSETAKNGLAGKEWVLRFEETEVTIGSAMGVVQENGTYVSEVTILRLKFETDGKVYNLGVVDNKQSKPPDAPPDNSDEQKPNLLEQFFAWLENVTGVPAWVWKMIAILIPIAILMPILAAIFPVVGVVLKWIVKGIGYLFYYLFKALWWLISAPFRLIAYIVKKRKGKKESGE